MARARRESRYAIDAWPGFVDALSTLLLSIIFLLVVFVLGQFFLGRMLEGRNETVAQLRGEVETLEQQLGLEKDTSADLRRSLSRLSADLQSLMGERDDARVRLSAAEQERSALDAQVAQLGNERTVLQRALEEARLDRQDAQNDAASLQRELEAARQTVDVNKETIQAQLGELAQLKSSVEDLTSLRDDLRKEVEQLSANLETSEQQRAELEKNVTSESGARAEAVARVNLLTQQIRTLSTQLSALEDALSTKTSEVDKQNQQIAELGQRLNLALATKVEELSQARSDFFGRLRRILGEREDVRVVGDRFVFQSEVLFQSGEADLGPRGQEQLAKFADTFKPIMGEIPDELNWVLQVDGHTDRRPISTPRFPSNWELSTARAISVARFLVSQGIPPERVAARGFAEWQPLDPGTSEEAYRRNRRIEIKLTTR